MRRWSCRAPGFTLVELLAAVLVLAILMAVALPLYLSAVASSARRTARGNMHTLVNAEQVFRLKYGYYTRTPQNLVNSNVIDKLPVGPGDTRYTLHPGEDPDNPEGADSALPDGRTVPPGGVAVCGSDARLGAAGDYGCFIPGQDTE
ncbi:MAG: type II secretion system protein [Chloroherpetonaceae bacterium]|nr:type II secretion system GspH family protein [Chthonomonadaceae bacterium]MDW8206913.1 type II secretion system protein [Chloroherpetonaceae bacterium]